MGTDSCQVPHTLYQVSGVMRVRMDDGMEITIRPGDVANIPPGHDAWVEGDQPAISVNVTPQMAEAFGNR
jgi:quercetin dioxygenase-like cupin family protein